MSDAILGFLQIMGSLGIFIYGMKVMSEGIQKVAGDNLRKILGGMTANRYMAVLTGFVVTGLVQSSSATTVMVVSFVNAGLLSLVQSMGVIMGANIGTTLTAWLITIFGFKVKIVSIAIPIIGLAFPFLFARRSKYKNIAEFVIGFGILFIGLDFLKDSVPDIKSNPEFLSFIASYTNYGFLSILIFIAVGALITVIVQSSSASLAITLVMVAQGWIEFDMAAAMFLGGNIGTTVTAILAAMVANIHAKRAALFHFMFNILGVCWILFVFNTFLEFIDQFLHYFYQASAFSPDPEVHKEVTTLALSIFHTTFNTINVALLILFVPLLAKLIIKMMPSKGELDEEFHLNFIGTGLMDTPELSITEARKEIQLFGHQLQKMSDGINDILLNDPKNFNKTIDKLKKWEEITDRLEIEIANYLSSCASGSLSTEASQRIRSMMNMINDMERIGDIFYQMSLCMQRIRENKITFPEDAQKGLKELLDNISEFLQLMNKNLYSDFNTVSINPVYDMENTINTLRDKLREENAIRLEKAEYNVTDGIMYLDIVNSAEKIGDHIVNVNEAIVGLK
ncbi:Na/Pi cotransporter family protein [Candidatus Amoebophilus asiaticus]|nr:Na/Pi cotransporter family protein [Candidatus Amoebophilus asiaticus]